MTKTLEFAGDVGIPIHVARPRKSDPQQRDWPRIRTIVGRRGTATYQVDSLRDLTPRRRQSFKDRAQADAFAEHLRQLRNNNGLAALGLTPRQMDDARKALEILRGSGLESLTEAAKVAVKHNRPGGGDIDLATLREKFIEAKRRKGRRERSIADLEARTKLFIESFRREEVDPATGTGREVYPLAKDLSPKQVQDWFDGRGFTVESAQTAKNYRRILHTFFEWSMAPKQRYLASNPVKDVEIPECAGSQPGILSVEQCRSLLETARTRFPEFVPYVTLGLFCGLRPEAELERLEWSDVQIERERVHIPITKTKISLPRNVSLSANAIEWLMLCPKKEGRILPARFRTRWDHLRWLAGFRTRHRPTLAERAMLAPRAGIAERTFAEWPADGMRHTFATNHLAFHHNAPLTSAQMGHLRATTIVMYCGLEPQTDPAEFWSLRPLGPLAANAHNIVPLGATG